MEKENQTYMIRKILFIITIISMTASQAFPQFPEELKRKVDGIPAELLLRQKQGATLTIGNMKLNGIRTKPTTVKVDWTISLASNARIEGYVLELELSKNGVTDKVIQTPSPSSTSVFVGLLGISAENRAKLFGDGAAVNAKMTLKAKLIKGTQRLTVTQTKSATI